MVTIPTIRTSNHEAISTQNEIISSSDGKVICKTERGKSAQFLALSSNTYHSAPDTRLTKTTTHKRKLLLLNRLKTKTQLTELDYLESSGTQVIETKLDIDTSSGAQVVWLILRKTQYSNVLSTRNFQVNAGGFCVPYWNGDVNALFDAVFMTNGQYPYNLNEEVSLGKKYTSRLNYLNDKKITLNDTSLGTIPNNIVNYPCKNPILFGSARNGVLFNSARLTGRIYSAKISRGAKLEMDLIPVLNADGEPGMWDKVSKRFFGNADTGTFGYALKGQGESSTYSLRNPGVVPPSGVYARKSGENTLEILADTETTSGDGWKRFANTAEAYEHFGIVPEREEFLTE